MLGLVNGHVKQGGYHIQEKCIPNFFDQIYQNMLNLGPCQFLQVPIGEEESFSAKKQKRKKNKIQNHRA